MANEYLVAVVNGGFVFAARFHWANPCWRPGHYDVLVAQRHKMIKLVQYDLWWIQHHADVPLLPEFAVYVQGQV